MRNASVVDFFLRIRKSVDNFVNQLSCLYNQSDNLVCSGTKALW